MTTISAIHLKPEIDSQMVYVERAHQRVLECRELLSERKAYILESSGLRIHNYYTAVEELLAMATGVVIPNDEDFYIRLDELAEPMNLPNQNARPELLARETAQLLSRLRAFRYFIRHSHNVGLNPVEIQANIDYVIAVHPQITKQNGCGILCCWWNLVRYSALVEELENGSCYVIANTPFGAVSREQIKEYE
jgi:hypothetical protein